MPDEPVSRQVDIDHPVDGGDEGEGEEVLEEGREDGIVDPASRILRLSVESELPVLDAEDDVRPVVVVPVAVVDVVVGVGVDLDFDVVVVAAGVVGVEVGVVDPGMVGQREGHGHG